MFSHSESVVTFETYIGWSCRLVREGRERLFRRPLERLHELPLAMFTFYFTASVKENDRHPRLAEVRLYD
jgi:hypothetical protein